MSAGNGSRIIHRNGGNPVAKQGGYVTREEARAIAEEIAVKVAEYYFKQVPAHVTGMINGALVAYGLVELTPVKGVSTEPVVSQTDGADADLPSGDVAQTGTIAPVPETPDVGGGLA